MLYRVPWLVSAGNDWQQNGVENENHCKDWNKEFTGYEIKQCEFENLIKLNTTNRQYIVFNLNNFKTHLFYIISFMNASYLASW